MNVMLFTQLVGQLYTEALSRYNDLDIELFSVMQNYWQSIILICFDCNINFESFLTYDLPLRQHSLLKLTCCKLAIINVINNHRLNKTFSRSEGVAKLIIMVWSVPNFRQEIRQSYCRNDNVKYDLGSRNNSFYLYQTLKSMRFG